MIDDHYDECDGGQCYRVGCPPPQPLTDVGQFRQGEVIAIRPDGAVEVEWSDGTTSILSPKRLPRAVDKQEPLLLNQCLNPKCLCHHREGESS